MNGPLQGIRVLDLTTLLPGPYCTMLLADQGAEVLKIERPGEGDPNRWEQASNGARGYVFDMVNRNKKSVALDLKSDKGVAALKALVKTADVFVEGFRPGKLSALGLDHETLQAVNPGLVYCSLSGFGQEGPRAFQPAHDLNYLGYAGVLDHLGGRGKPPIVPGIQIADMSGAITAALGIMFALFGRQRAGRGRYLDVSMYEAAIPFLAPLAGLFFATGDCPRRGEAVFSGGAASYNVYETKDGRFLTVAAWEQKFWANFCRLIGRPDLESQRHAVGEAGEAAIKEVQGVLRTRTMREWLHVLEDGETCVGPVLSIEEALRDPQAKSRRIVSTVQHPSKGELSQLDPPIKFTPASHGVLSPPPGLGEHTEEILTELGLDGG